MTKSNTPYILAHRGDHLLFPENTLEALEEAASIGVDGFELDIRSTSDGEVILHHDASLERLSNHASRIYTLSRQNLKQFSLKNRKNRSTYYTTSFTYLYQILERFVHHYIINIEVKLAGEMTGRLVKNLVKLLQDLSQLDNIIISSFYPYILKDLKQALPEVKTGFLFDKVTPKIKEEWYKEEYSYLHPHYILFKNEKISRELLQIDKGIITWTVNKIPEYLVSLIPYITGLITDDPLYIMEKIS